MAAVKWISKENILGSKDSRAKARWPAHAWKADSDGMGGVD